MNLAEKQFQWVDHIQKHSTTEILCCKVNGKKFSKWLPYKTFKEIGWTLRTLADHEAVIDFDGKNKKHNIAKAAEVITVLQKTNYPFYLTDHNGRGNHIHVFNISRDIAAALLKRVGTKAAEILTGKHMCRDAGGLYKDGRHYCSVFDSIESIYPITEADQVKFPKLTNIKNTNGINNYCKPDLEKYYTPLKFPNREGPEVTIDNLPKKYRHLQNGARVGERNTSTAQLIGVLKKCGLSRSEAYRQILDFNGRCAVPLPHKEVSGMFRRLYR